jgi:hypothetical protein
MFFCCADCLDQCAILPVDYNHRPITTGRSQLGSDIVIGITNYQVCTAP